MANVSVLMSTYKEEEMFLRKSIESILNQTYTDFEFIIILDDPENELHKKIINEYQEEDQRIHFFINKKNMGLTKSLNYGLTKCNGKYICRMDADDISLPNRIQHQLEYIEKNSYDLIGGITQIVDENDKPIYSISKVPSNFESIKRKLRYNQCIAHPTWFGKKDVFETLNGYREIPLCEDYDFTLRAVLKGFKISNIEETVLKYRMTGNSISRSNLFRQYLFAKYITSQYSRGNVANIEDVYKYVEMKFDEKNSKKYTKANVYFNNLLNNIERKEFILFICNGFKLLFASKYYLNKVWRLFMVSIDL